MKPEIMWNGSNSEYCEKHCDHKWIDYDATCECEEYGIENFVYCEKCGLPASHSDKYDQEV